MQCSPTNRPTRCNSLSSSSCSSLSATSLHWDSTIVRRNNSASDEDCTINEMMGKYDESYVYEKETDILSDSDPTDCDTDIDTGQDGGDEEDTKECEFDFIDNGSYLEFNIDNREERNLGHCTYYNFEIQRRTSRRRTTRRASIKPANETRRRSSSSSKKRVKQLEGPSKSNCQLMNHFQIDGSRSAGATPLSVRRSNLPISKLAVENCLRKRSNSVSFTRNPVSTFDKRDKEADKKYKELIVEAEHILMNMKSNGLSPRRLPGPPNKRVELLRTAESSKPDAFIKARLTDEAANVHLARTPSNNFNSPRFSPKRNHITNFINHNSPVLAKKEKAPVVPEVRYTRSSNNSPQLSRSKHALKSPKHKKKMMNKAASLNPNIHCSSSSDSEEKSVQKTANKEVSGFCCPQSEPVRRKVYSKKCKSVAFNLDCENINSQGECYVFHTTQKHLQKNKFLQLQNRKYHFLPDTWVHLTVIILDFHRLSFFCNV